MAGPGTGSCPSGDREKNRNIHINPSIGWQAERGPLKSENDQYQLPKDTGFTGLEPLFRQARQPIYLAGFNPCGAPVY